MRTIGFILSLAPSPMFATMSAQPGHNDHGEEPLKAKELQHTLSAGQ